MGLWLLIHLFLVRILAIRCRLSRIRRYLQLNQWVHRDRLNRQIAVLMDQILCLLGEQIADENCTLLLQEAECARIDSLLKAFLFIQVSVFVLSPARTRLYGLVLHALSIENPHLGLLQDVFEVFGDLVAHFVHFLRHVIGNVHGLTRLVHS